MTAKRTKVALLSIKHLQFTKTCRGASVCLVTATCPGPFRCISYSICCLRQLLIRLDQPCESSFLTTQFATDSHHSHRVMWLATAASTTTTTTPGNGLLLYIIGCVGFEDPSIQSPLVWHSVYAASYSSVPELRLNLHSLHTGVRWREHWRSTLLYPPRKAGRKNSLPLRVCR